MTAHQLIKEQRRETNSVLRLPAIHSYFVEPRYGHGCIIQVMRPLHLEPVYVYGLDINSTNRSWTVCVFDNHSIAMSYTLNKVLAQLFDQSKNTCILFYLKPRISLCVRSLQILFHNQDVETLELTWSSSVLPDDYPTFPKSHYPGLMQIGYGLWNPGNYSQQSSAQILANFMLIDCPRSLKSLDFFINFQCIFNNNDKQNWCFPLSKWIKLLSTKFATVYAIPLSCSTTPLFMDDRFVKKWIRSLKSNQPLENLQLTWNPVVLPQMQYYYFDIFDAEGELVCMRDHANPIRFYFLTTDSRRT